MLKASDCKSRRELLAPDPLTVDEIKDLLRRARVEMRLAHKRSGHTHLGMKYKRRAV